MTEVLEIKKKQHRANRRSIHRNYTKSVINFNTNPDNIASEDEFNSMAVGRALSMPHQSRNKLD